MSEHTKEPWSIDKYGHVLDSNGKDLAANGFTTICNSGERQECARATTRRIVACVNACAGIPTAMLEAIPEWEKAGVQTANKLMQQRDELAAMLERIANQSSGWGAEDFRRAARAALSRLEEQK